MKKKICVVLGTRPEAIKMAPVIKEIQKNKRSFSLRVLSTAQHRHMLDDVLGLFRIRPDFDLNIMKKNQTLSHITTRALSAGERVLEKEKPDLVLVQGDTTTAFALALAAFYKRIPVGHVEAGLRSYDPMRPYPEEMNRILIDAMAALHFAPTATAKRALLKERRNAATIFVTGNTGIDALYTALAMQNDTKERRAPAGNNSILVTAHRRENFGAPFENIFRALRRVAERYPDLEIIYPVHPNPNVNGPARKLLAGIRNITLTGPLGYRELVRLMSRARFLVTDSGGLQEEGPALGKPVLVLRTVTERPEAVKAGTARIIGHNENRVFKEICALMDSRARYRKMAHAVNPYGDGKAAQRTVEAIQYYFGLRPQRPAEFMSHDRKI